MRAISTVVDVTVALLLIGGAVATLASAPDALSEQAGRDRADEQARVLATTTATVEYSITASESAEGVRIDAPESALDRTARGTVASLLGDAAIASATVDGERLLPTTRGYERAITDLAQNRTLDRDVRTAVRAVWEPYPDAPVRGAVRVGPRPPADADVDAARLTAPSGVRPSRNATLRAAEADGFRGVAQVVAEAVVDGLFPTDEVRLALRDDAPVDALTVRRYRRAARLLDAGRIRVANGDVERANERLATALTDRFAADLRGRYHTPRAAARNVSTGRVRIVVRTWSP